MRKNFEQLLNVIVTTKKCNLPENYLEKVGKAQKIFENNKISEKRQQVF